MDLLDELGDEIQIKAEDLCEDETEIEAVFFSDSLLELKDENQTDAQLYSTSESEMETTTSFKKSDASPQEALETLSDRSYSSYLNTYEGFKRWQESKAVNSFDEPVLLDYFRESSEKYKPTTLTSMYTRLKYTILCNHNINIAEYSRLFDFLKNNADGFQSKKLKVFTADDVDKFLTEAPDDKYLAMKAVLVFGLIRMCSFESLCYLVIDQVEDTGDEIIVRISHPKTKVVKAHVIGGQFAEIVRKYIKLRPRNVSTDRFFLQYRDGKCINQAVARDKIAKYTKEIAKFLKLPEYDAYGGNSFHITSKTISADTGAAIETTKGNGKRRSNRIAAGNVQEFLGQQREIDTFIVEEIDLPSTSNFIIASHENSSKIIAIDGITNAESSSLGYVEISDESTGDIPENNSLSENEGAFLQEALNETLPDNTYSRYLNAYEVFKKWQESKEASFAEPVLLDYFRELSEKYKPSTLFDIHSMLQPIILLNHNINISEYSQLSTFLKEKGDEKIDGFEKSDGFPSKKSKLFSAHDINKFLIEAPDDNYLAMKTVLVFTLIGACSLETVTYVETRYVTDNGNEIILTIPHPKTKVVKPHIIGGQFAEIVRKYMKLRPKAAITDRFFMQYRDGKCKNQVIGRNTIAKLPKEIAKFLKLPESEDYNGNSFRVTSIVAILADTSVASETMKLHGELISSRAAEGYVQGPKTNIAEEINSPSTSNVIVASHENASIQIPTDIITCSESPSLGYVEISDESTHNIPELNSLSENEESFDSNDDTGLKRHHRTKAPKRKRKKRPKRQKKIDWYNEECLSQIKLTTDMFRRFSKMAEDDKMKLLSEFSMHRVDLFQKYFAAMNTVPISPINTPKTAASINTVAHNGRMTDANGVIHLD